MFKNLVNASHMSSVNIALDNTRLLVKYSASQSVDDIRYKLAGFGSKMSARKNSLTREDH